MSLLDSLPGIVAGALGPIFKAANIVPPGVATSDGQGGKTIADGTPISCLALITDYSDALIAFSNGVIQVRDRKAIVLAEGLPAGSIPRIGWKLSQDGAMWSVINAKRDPAGATYEIQLRPA